MQRNVGIVDEVISVWFPFKKSYILFGRLWNKQLALVFTLEVLQCTLIAIKFYFVFKIILKMKNSNNCVLA